MPLHTHISIPVVHAGQPVQARRCISWELPPLRPSGISCTARQPIAERAEARRTCLTVTVVGCPAASVLNRSSALSSSTAPACTQGGSRRQRHEGMVLTSQQKNASVPSKALHASDQLHRAATRCSKGACRGAMGFYRQAIGKLTKVRHSHVRLLAIAPSLNTHLAHLTSTPAPPTSNRCCRRCSASAASSARLRCRAGRSAAATSCPGLGGRPSMISWACEYSS